MSKIDLAGVCNIVTEKAFLPVCQQFVKVAISIFFTVLVWLIPTQAQVQPTISTPTSSYSSSYTTPQTVTITTSSGSLFFTTDGSLPSNTSTPYTGAFTVSRPTQINAVSYLSGNYSPVATMFVDIDPSLDPILQPGLLLRLRADFGIIPAAGSPAPVNSWADLSGNNGTTTGYVGSQPIVNSNAINSLPAVNFNGSSQYLTLPSGFADFTKTLIRITNAPPFANSTQTITINGSNANYSSTTSDTNSTIATGLASAINALLLSGISASASGNIIQVTAPVTTTFSASPMQSVMMQIQNSGATIFVVTEPTALTAGARILDLGQGASGNNVLFQIASSGSKGQFSVFSGTSGTNAQSANALTANQFQILSAVQVPGASSGTATFYVNGTPGTANPSMNNIPNTTRTSNFLGQASGAGNFYSGKICEVLVYSTRLALSQMSSITAMLAQKYQLNSQMALAPVFSVPGGTLTGPTQVVIATQPGSKTFLTFDNSTPTNASTPYNGAPITINYTQTVKAISTLNGIQSPVSAAVYTLDSNLFPPPGSSATAPSINLQLPAPSL